MWEKSSPCEEQSTQNVLFPGHREHLWTFWELKCCSGTLTSLLKFTPSIQRSGTIRVLKSHGRFTQACRTQHRAECYPCCTWRMKTKARFPLEISLKLKTSLFRKEKPNSLSPTGWTRTSPTLQYPVVANTIKFPLEKLAQDFSLLRTPQLPKASEQPSPSNSSTDSKAYAWASTTR